MVPQESEGIQETGQKFSFKKYPSHRLLPVICGKERRLSAKNEKYRKPKWESGFRSFSCFSAYKVRRGVSLRFHFYNQCDDPVGIGHG
jgi:hypothetical protein